MNDRLVDDQRVVVVGATGWLGMVALDLLESALGTAFETQVSAWASRGRCNFGRVPTSPYATYAMRCPADVEGALVLHFAFLTRDRVAAMGADEFIANDAITQRVLSLIAGGAPSGVVYARRPAPSTTPTAGSRSTRSPIRTAPRSNGMRSPFASCSHGGASCVIHRVFSVSGPYMTKPELYALGDLILQAKGRDRLHIRVTRPVYRSYIALHDLLSVCIAAALDGERDPRVRLRRRRDRGRRPGELGTSQRRRADMPIERRWDPSADADRYVADNTAMAALAQRYGVSLQSLPHQVAATAADLTTHAAERR